MNFRFKVPNLSARASAIVAQLDELLDKIAPRSAQRELPPYSINELHDRESSEKLDIICRAFAEQ